MTSWLSWLECWLCGFSSIPHVNNAFFYFFNKDTLISQVYVFFSFALSLCLEMWFYSLY